MPRLHNMQGVKIDAGHGSTAGHLRRICQAKAVAQALILCPVIPQRPHSAGGHLIFDKARIDVGAQHFLDMLLGGGEN